ncbi:type VI secretion system baseplate subunit TssK [Paraburkholderia edwinii]|uniref:Type VI secretion system baseplate subunit TssK n=1 Tax=Paraburkholderia edwinii TaxID=2861782 RepID=A0ABX8UK92_9BURK|nr:type VI secretion system baseplate subunit TssK [Paraburkholderia edwinii]QYD69437.1 type VI secretion system baseplate subunit TssK [Paraburkholderia edwinii]
MSWYNKVVWNEGLFLRPQLFQQQERYLEQYAHKRVAPLSPFFFGFNHFAIDREALALGKVIVKAVDGVFADGTPFSAPGDAPPPEPLTIRAEHLEQVIHLAAPIRMPNGEETTFDAGADSLARYAVFDTELRDTNSIGQGAKSVQLSRLRLRLVPEKELTDGWLGLPLAKVKIIRADGSIELDETLVPPVCGYGASALLESWLGQIHELTRLRADALAKRLTGNDGKAGSVAEVSDYLLLQTLNRYEPLLQHLRRVPTTSPVELYSLLTAMAGELSTYVRSSTRRPLASHPPYQHIEPHSCLRPVVEDTHWLLNAVLVRSAQAIALEDSKYGMRNAVVNPAELRSFTSVVLAVSAAMPPDVLVAQFATQAKMGPSAHLPDLVRAHLPGITLQALPVPPRQIPFNSGYVYFELSRSGPLWEAVAQHGGIALHVAGDFPQLKLELWGVRG